MARKGKADVVKAENFGDVFCRADRMEATKAERAAFRLYLERKPEAWRQTADMMRQARSNLIERISSTGAAKELALHGCKELQKELSQPSDGPLESLLVDVVITAWLRLSLMEQAYDCVLTGADKRFSTETGLFWEKRLSMVTKRFHLATANLARVRRLNRPKEPKRLTLAQVNAYLGSGNVEASALPLGAMAAQGLRKAMVDSSNAPNAQLG